MRLTTWAVRHDGAMEGGPEGNASAGGGADVRGVLSVLAYRRLWIALAFSSFGDWLGLLAQTALAAQLAGNGTRAQGFAISGVLLVRLLPSVLLGPLAGALADRVDRRVVMVVADLLRAALFVVIAFAPSLLVLNSATFAVEICALFWTPAKEAAVPNLIRKDQLEAGNQLSLLTTYGSAPVAAGVFALLSSVNRGIGALSGAVNANPVTIALLFDAGTFLLGALVVVNLHEVSGRTGARADQVRRRGLKAFTGLFSDTAEGIRFIGETPLVRGLVVGILGAFAAGAALAATGRQYVQLLGGGNAGYGLLFGGVFVGLASGMALGPRLLAGLSRARLFGLSIIGAGASLSVVSVLPNLVVALGGVLVVGGFAGVGWVSGYTLLQSEVDDALRGRTFATLGSLVRTTMFVILAAAPAAAALIGYHQIDVGHEFVRADGTTVVLFVSGLLALFVGISAYRQMDDRPGEPLLRDLRLAVLGRLRAPSHDHPGFFVALEGGEGAGKSTQLKMLATALEELGHEVVTTREPGATAVGLQLRKLLLDPETSLAPEAEALLYAADRAQHVAEVVRPALLRGCVVVTDRYVDSSLAYQGAARELAGVATVQEFATGRLLPDLTVVLDLDPVVGLARAASRGKGQDRLEAEALAFHTTVRSGFLALARARPGRYAVVDVSDLDAVAVHNLVLPAVLRQLPRPAGAPG